VGFGFHRKTTAAMIEEQPKIAHKKVNFTNVVILMVGIKVLSEKVSAKRTNARNEHIKKVVSLSNSNIGYKAK
jgi:glucose uptake protein GlcU